MIHIFNLYNMLQCIQYNSYNILTMYLSNTIHIIFLQYIYAMLFTRYNSHNNDSYNVFI